MSILAQDYTRRIGVYVPDFLKKRFALALGSLQISLYQDKTVRDLYLTNLKNTVWLQTGQKLADAYDCRWR